MKCANIREKRLERRRRRKLYISKECLRVLGEWVGGGGERRLEAILTTWHIHLEFAVDLEKGLHFYIISWIENLTYFYEKNLDFKSIKFMTPQFQNFFLYKNF